MYGKGFLFVLATLFVYACGSQSIPNSPNESQLSSLSDAKNVAWVARHNLTASQYQAEVDRLVGQGYRPSYISAAGIGNEARYAAIFETDDPGIPWIARHGLSNEQYQAEFARVTALGYRPAIVNGYTVGNVDYYTAIWEKRSGPGWIARHALTSAAYQEEVNKQTQAGYRLTHVSGYSVNGEERYAALWEQSPGPAWSARHGMTEDTYQTEFNRLSAQGYRLVMVSAFTVNGQDRFAAIWEQRTGLPLIARHGLSSAQYQQDFNEYRYQGYRPAVISAYGSGSSDRYAAIWHNPVYSARELDNIDATVENLRQAANIPGISIAIAKDGRLVFAKGYGSSDQERGTPTLTSNLFRIASVSKPITATAILKLVDQGKLRLDQTVFGPAGVLGDAYGSKRPYNANVTEITIRQLLAHTAGGWTNDNNDPMFTHPEMNATQLINWTLDNRPLDNTPGKVYAYSNFGYSILGRVMEKVTGQDYQSYVKQHVLGSSPNMQIAGNTRMDRKPNEVLYYDAFPESPYSMEVARMDAHGGWLASPIDLVRFGVSVDAFPTKPDQLSAASLSTMVQGSMANSGYGLGWSVNSAGHYWHTGSLPGTSSILVRTSGGFVWSAVTNSRDNNPDIDGMMWNVVSHVSAWPTYDLF